MSTHRTARSASKQVSPISQAALYIRVSTTNQEEKGSSIQTQEERCRQFATARGYIIDDAQVYTEVYSGDELWDRPQLNILRDAIRHGQIAHVVTYAIDRLSRDPVHLGVILSEAEHHGVQVEFVTEPLDNTPEGQLIRFVRGYAAKIELEKIRERNLRGKHARLRNGKIHGHGIERYGYRRDKENGKRIPYEPEAVIVRQIFQWYAQEKRSLHALVKHLNDSGVLSPSVGKVPQKDSTPQPRWGKATIHRILREPAYKGLTISWRFNGDGALKPESEWLHLPGDVTPPLVSLALWCAAQERLDSNTGESFRNNDRPYLLRGRVLCAVCGRKMRLSTERRGREKYRCASRETPSGSCGGGRVPIVELEAWVWGHIAALIQDPKKIAVQLERQSHSGPDPRLVANQEAIQHSLAQLDKQQTKLVRAFRQSAEESYPVDLIQRELAQLEQEKAQLRSTLIRIEEQLTAAQVVRERLDSLQAYCEQVRRDLQAFGFEEKCKALDAFSVTVVATGRDCKDWRISVIVPEHFMTGTAPQASWGWDRVA
jgi:site-specific DNA recombinase